MCIFVYNTYVLYICVYIYRYPFMNLWIIDTSYIMDRSENQNHWSKTAFPVLLDLVQPFQSAPNLPETQVPRGRTMGKIALDLDWKSDETTLNYLGILNAYKFINTYKPLCFIILIMVQLGWHYHRTTKIKGYELVLHILHLKANKFRKRGNDLSRCKAVGPSPVQVKHGESKPWCLIILHVKIHEMQFW